MKKIILLSGLLLMCLSTSVLFAAEGSKARSNKEKENPVVFRAGILGPRLGLEFGFSKKLTVAAGLGLHAYVKINDDDDDDSDFHFPLSTDFSLRYYYNLDSRQARGKRTEKFAANYVGLMTRKYFSAAVKNFFVGPVWGIQRNFGRIGYWDFYLGSGLEIEHSKAYANISGGFIIGFSF